MNKKYTKRKRSKLLLEKAKRRKIRKIIKEEIDIIHEHMKVCDIVILKEAEMRRMGYPQKVINEALSDFIAMIPGGMWKYLKQYLGNMLISKVGLNTDSILGYSLANTIENMHWDDITSYFGGDCQPLVSLILKSFEEGLAEKGMDYIAKAIFGRKLDGIFSGTAREMITTQMEEMTQQMREPLEKALCDLDFTGLMTGLKNIFGNISNKFTATA